ncbi:MAG: hypothetical protein GEU99_20250 [Luteitalea sp.]|nr:hypothetical protein [Luteitalea sp.]
MSDVQWIGLLAVVAGGVCQGGFMLPMKWTREWAWENTWLVFASTAYLLLPWLLVFAAVPAVFEVYGQASTSKVLLILLFGVGWGTGAITFGLGVAALGMALGFAVILGVAATVGALVPLLLFDDSLSPAGLLLTLVSLAVMLAGVVVCSLAGRWQQAGEAKQDRRYVRGVALCVASGLLSACGNIGFAFGTDLIDAFRQRGVSENWAAMPVWSLLTTALFLCNAGYAGWLLAKNRTASNFRLPQTGAYYLYGTLMGAAWIGGFVFYGAGALRMGALGPSLGWAILMSMMVATANLLGLVTGEWRDAPSASARRLYGGLLLLLLAIAGLGYANYTG